MPGHLRTLSTIALLTVSSAGCLTGGVSLESEDASAVAAKALDIAAEVGGESGFGGSLMEGYVDHMPSRMGFRGVNDLASEAESMMVLVRNESDRDGTFHLSYFASHMGLDEQLMDVGVRSGEEVSVEIPCSEIVGMGPLDMPGEAGCHLDDGESVDNTMAVPGFLGQDFMCQGTYECVLTQDVDDLDGDGDTEELIIMSDALGFHMTNGGPTEHMHDTRAGVMGSHMGM